MRKLRNIQVLRGIAALMVVFFHSFGQVPETKEAFGHLLIGGAGVDIFFVISGFVIYLSVTKQHVTVPGFISDRVIRIVPLYWFYTLAMVAIWLVAPSLFRTLQVSRDTLMMSLFFIPHYSQAFPNTIFPLLVPGWSLNYEVFFYILAALGLLVLPGRMLQYMAASILALVLIGYLAHPASAAGFVYTNPLMFEFLGGAAIGRVFLDERFNGRAWMSLFLPAGIVLLGLNDVISYAALPAALFPSLMIVAGLVAMETNGLVIRSQFGKLLGDAAYSIYLSHLFTLGAARALWTKFGPTVDGPVSAMFYFIIMVAAAAFVGVLAYLAIERPMLSYLRNLRSSRNKAGLQSSIIASDTAPIIPAPPDSRTSSIL